MDAHTHPFTIKDSLTKANLKNYLANCFVPERAAVIFSLLGCAVRMSPA
jgi:hypothetical protein